MNEYIINPNWFYWINTIGDASRAISVIAGIGACTTVLGLCVGCIKWCIGVDFGEDDRDFLTAKAIFKVIPYIIAVTIIFGIISIFLPSEDTLIEMQVAKLATYQNAENAIEAVKSATEYIINAISSMK